MSFTPAGTRIVGSTIRERKTILREQLRKTRCFATLARALESAPGARLTGEEVNRLIAFTTAPADDLVLNIINWGRYTELFRYDQEEEVLTLIPIARLGARPSTAREPQAGPSASTAEGAKGPGKVSPAGDTTLHTAQGIA